MSQVEVEGDQRRSDGKHKNGSRREQIINLSETAREELKDGSLGISLVLSQSTSAKQRPISCRDHLTR
eukprot:764485-Hanusia_phi.AAC.2